MQITVRVPTEQYAYLEVKYESLEEYVEGYPKFVHAVSAVRKKIKKEKEEEVPFDNEPRIKLVKDKFIPKTQEEIKNLINKQLK